VSISFEQAFANAERSAAAAAKAGAQIVSAAKQMQKAAQEGNIRRLHESAERLGSATDAARQDVANARGSWPFAESDERDYLANGYEDELRDEAERAGLKLQSRDSRLLAYPSIVQISPADLSVKIDKKRVRSIRPRYLVSVLLANQKKKPRQSAQVFIDCLYETYNVFVHDKDVHPVVKLADIYRLLTLLPGSDKDYTKSDFTLDLYALDVSPTSTTRSGQVISLPASTGTKGRASDLFTFVAPDGEVKTYYGIRFTEG
jgi:hypothetical protein